MYPETKYAPLGGERIAYQVLGHGPPDLVLTFGSFGHVNIVWEDPVSPCSSERFPHSRG